MPIFLFNFIFYNIHTGTLHSFNHIHTIHLSIAILSISSTLVCSVGKHLPVVPRRELNSGLPYSKPTRYQLSHAAPDFRIAKTSVADPYPLFRGMDPRIRIRTKISWIHRNTGRNIFHLAMTDLRIITVTRVAYPHHFNADPVPTFHLSGPWPGSCSSAQFWVFKASEFWYNAEGPDPVFHSNADPDPASLMRIRIQLPK